jgi:hypothetical protein
VAIELLSDVWTMPAVAAAILGGAAVGWAVEVIAPVRPWRSLVAIVLGIGTLAALVFWTGQVMDSVLSGDPAWPRAVARAGLQLLFVLAMALAAGFSRWREPPPK